MDEQLKYFKSRQEWRDWLQENHDKFDGVWLLYYKKHIGEQTISYEDAVLEALAFGWIDSIVHKIDDKKYKQRFTPRRKGSVWSETNLNRVNRLISEGLMTQAGLTAAQPVLTGKVKPEGSLKDISMPSDLKKRLEEDLSIWNNFENFPPSSKKIFYNWIEMAKRQETRKKRIEKTVLAAKNNNKIGYM